MSFCLKESLQFRQFFFPFQIVYLNKTTKKDKIAFNLKVDSFLTKENMCFVIFPLLLVIYFC